MLTNNHIISSTSNLHTALERINALSGGNMTLFVVDGNACLVGTLTDGDVRRALLAGIGLDYCVTEAMHRNFRVLHSGTPDVEALRAMRKKGITLVPVVDDENRIERIIDLTTTRTLLPLSAILMAGGKGERMRPATLTTPKPLLTIQGKAIIDYNVEALAACGITDITVTTRYLAEQLHAHFNEPVCGVQVKCVTETTPLGTIGAATLVSRSAFGNTLVMNSDLITTISFEDMYMRHVTEQADITVAAIPYQVSVPYAILNIDGQQVTGIAEKPAYSYYANAGIYIIRDEVLNSLPADTRTDATDLIERVINDGGRVVYHPINGTWIDVGSPTEFRQATELMAHLNAMQNNNI